MGRAYGLGKVAIHQTDQDHKSQHRSQSIHLSYSLLEEFAFALVYLEESVGKAVGICDPLSAVLFKHLYDISPDAIKKRFPIKNGAIEIKYYHHIWNHIPEAEWNV